MPSINWFLTLLSQVGARTVPLGLPLREGLTYLNQL